MYLVSLATESLVERFSLLNSSVLRVEKFQTSLPVHVGCCYGASSTEQHDQSAFVFWRSLSIQLPSSRRYRQRLLRPLTMSSRMTRTLYVGNLPGDVREGEIEDLFYKYGRIIDVDLKVPPRPPGYCFIEFEDARDAEDAIRGRDGYNFDGHRIRVEFAHGGRRTSSSLGRPSSYSSIAGGRGGRGGVTRHTDYRVLVTGLPSSASWQDLKDHMRRAGDVCYAEVFRDSNGTRGTVDYTNLEDMKYAIRKLDDSEFRNAFSRSYIQVKEYGPKRSISRSYSRSRSRSRSHSRSNTRRHSRSISVGRTNRSRSRSLTRSPRRLPPSKVHGRSASKSRSSSRSL